MKRFFILLVLTNLAMAGWLYWRANFPEPVEVSKSAPPSQGGLRLLSEISPVKLPSDSGDSRKAAVAPSIEAAMPAEVETPTGLEPQGETIAAETKVACLIVRSTIKAPDVKQLRSKAKNLKLNALASGEEMVERQSYWVYIAPYKSANAVRDAASLLAKSKVRDFLVVRSGEYQNGISLGLFSQQERAERRLQEIKRLKLAIKTPLIQPRSTMVRSYWLRLQLADERDAQTLISLLAGDEFQTDSEECQP